MHTSDDTQEFIPIFYNKQYNVDNLVHLCCERRKFAPIKPG